MYIQEQLLDIPRILIKILIQTCQSGSILLSISPVI